MDDEQQLQQQQQDEHTFLCGYQRTRGYGSLSNALASTKTYQAVIRHQVKPTDTLQGLVLKYNTSMSELKKLNRLWSNESLYLKQFVDVPIYDDDVDLRSASNPSLRANRSTKEHAKHDSDESVQDIFKRIDMNIKKTANIVHKLTKDSSTDLLAGDLDLGFSRNESSAKISNRRSLNYCSSSYQNEAFQN